MAKKQSLSYGPNMGLIAGEAQVAKSEAGLSNSVGAFAQGFMGVFGAIKKDEEEQAAKMEAYSAQVPSLDQIHFMKDESNKQVVRTFLNKQRDEYSRLAEIFDKTKDRGVKDKMEAIKFSLVNLNDQIKVFNQDKADYITAFDEGQLAKGNAQPNGAYFTDIYTNNSQFGVGDNGDLSFTVGGQTSLFKDRAGTWNPRNNISETFFLDDFQKQIGNAQKGIKFIESTTYNRLFNNLRSTGNDGLQALITQDLVGDRTNNTFEQQFASGTLDPKIYAGYESYKLDKSDPRFKEGEYEYDTGFMFKNENGDKVRGLVAQYFTDVIRTGHQNEFVAKENINNKNKNTGFLTTKKSIYNGSIKRYMKYNEAKSLYDRFKLSTERKDTYAIVDDVRYEYNAKDNNWYYGEGDDRINYGNPFDFLENMNISDPDFLSLTTATSDKNVSGKPIKPKDETYGTSFEDFQQDEYNFTTNIKSKYDFSDYVIKDTKGVVTDLLGFGESFGNVVDIVDKKGNVVYRGRTNYSDNKKAQSAAEKFNKFLIDNDIKPKTQPTEMTPTEKIKYYINNPT